METELKDELRRGQKAAEALVDHVKSMGAATGHLEVPDGNGAWVVEVRFEAEKEK